MVEGGHRRRRSAPWATTGSRLWLAVAISLLMGGWGAPGRGADDGAGGAVNPWATGGTPAKPVGTVCIAWGLKGGAPMAETRHFAGDREAVRRHTVERSLAGLLALLEQDK